VRCATFFACVIFAACSGREGASFIGERVDNATWVATTGQPFSPREHAAVVVLGDGRVLISGGVDGAGTPLATSEVYSPATDSWSPGPALSAARGRSAVAGERILGGSGVSGVPRADVDVVVGDAGLGAGVSLQQARASAAAVQLPNGAVLVIGGSGAASPHNSTELSLPDGGWGSGGLLFNGRTQPTATLLTDGRVLVTGGVGGLGVLASTELRAPDGGFALGPPMAVPRVRHTATRLPNGDVLIVGGDGDAGTSAELFVAATSTLRAVSGPKQPRAGHTATLLPSGQVLIAGGRGATSGEVFQADAGRFDTAGCLVRPRESHVAAPVGAGVLLAFGRGDGGVLAHSERFVPSGGGAQGSACSLDCQCATGFCSNGVCCDKACNGGCEACSAVTGVCAALTQKKVCRAVAGICDLEEVCDGVSPLCPADRVRDAGVACRNASGPCDQAESCNGTAPACPGDAKRPTGAVCREAVAACDQPERCDGDGGPCPPDLIASATTVCRPPAGACDAIELCSGSSVFCPEDKYYSPGILCRATADVCDVEESCQGGPQCPTDRFKHQSVECGLFSCSGDSAACRTSCGANAECAASAVCDAGLCVPFVPPPRPYVGFGCAQAGGGLEWLALAALLWLMVRRKGDRLLFLALVLVASSARAATPPEPGFWHTGTRGQHAFALRIDALLVKDLLHVNFGGEAGLTLALSERFDLGAWVNIGRYPGARLGVTLHTRDDGERFRPFLQVRGLVHPVPGGVAFGAGLFSGFTTALGPGRIVFGPMIEGYAGPAEFVSGGLFLVLGYQLDVYRAPNPWERNQIPPPREPEPVAPPPPPVVTPAPLPPPPTPAPEPVAPPPAVEPTPEPAAEPTPAPAPAEKVEDRTKLVTRIQIREQLLFGEKQSKLDPTLKVRVKRLGEALRQLSQVKTLEVAGHADDFPDEARCLVLSQKRADAVRDALIAAGVAKEKLVSKGYGRTLPLAPMSGPAKRREKNRRVDFNVLEMAP
jgi:outer membrane protein OmpA-like peptidoglycan-associated protein